VRVSGSVCHATGSDSHAGGDYNTDHHPYADAADADTAASSDAHKGSSTGHGRGPARRRAANDP
jgi:hypothetical protein